MDPLTETTTTLAETLRVSPGTYPLLEERVCRAPRRKDLPGERCPSGARWAVQPLAPGSALIPLCRTHANAATRTGWVYLFGGTP